jgi:hypothetical protein
MSRKQILLVMVAIAAALCCSIPTANAAKPHPHAHMHAGIVAPVGNPAASKAPRALQYVGFMMGDHEFYTQAQAHLMMQRVHDQGVNTVRLFIRWNHTPGPPFYDLQAVAYAAQAAEQVGLKALILGLTPTQSSWPLSDYDLQWFKDNITAYDKVLFDPDSHYLSHPSPLQIIWAIGNEPNVDTFCTGADKDPKTAKVGWPAQHQACADREARLLHTAYPLIQSEKTNPEYLGSLKSNDLLVIGGLLSSNDAPLDFMTQWIKARQDLGYKTCDMDIIGYNPYTMPGGDLYSGINLVPDLVKALKAMKCPVPIFFTEMGYPTRPPVDPGSKLADTLARMGYTDIPATIDPGLPLLDYIPTVSHAMALTLGYTQVIGALNMLLDDEQRVTNGWSSGWYYYSKDGQLFPKPFLAQVQQIFRNALNPPSVVVKPPTIR